MTYLLWKWLHIVSATALLGTGAGIAFFMWRAHRNRDVRVIAAVTRDVVRADLWFTAVAVIVQPVSGVALMLEAQYPVSSPWIWQSVLLYVLVGACWLPVVWLQMRMRDLAHDALAVGTDLPVQYGQYYRWWLRLGWPAFAGVLLILWLMVSKRGFAL